MDGTNSTAPDRLGSFVGTYPYGEEKSPTPTTGEKFATYYRDQTGLDYAMNRHYSSQYGRFTSPDPYMNSGGPANPGSWNRYAYVENDPVNATDSTGLLMDQCADKAEAAANPYCVQRAKDASMSAVSYLRPIYSFMLIANEIPGYVLTGYNVTTTYAPVVASGGGAVEEPAPKKEESDSDKWERAIKTATDCLFGALKEHYLGITGTTAWAALNVEVSKTWLPPYRSIGYAYTSLLSWLGGFMGNWSYRLAAEGLVTNNALRFASRALGTPLFWVMVTYDAVAVTSSAVECYTKASNQQP